MIRRYITFGIPVLLVAATPVFFRGAEKDPFDQKSDIRLPNFKQKMLPAVAAKVQDKDISGEDINLATAKWLERQKRDFYVKIETIPKDRRAEAARRSVRAIQMGLETLPQKMLAQKITNVIVSDYIITQEIKASPELITGVEKDLENAAKKQGLPLDEYKKQHLYTAERIRLVAAIRKINLDAATDEKIDKLITDHPEYFNGTRVKARHILLRSGPAVETAKQLAAIKKLKELAGQISGSTKKFGDAARDISD